MAIVHVYLMKPGPGPSGTIASKHHPLDDIIFRRKIKPVIGIEYNIMTNKKNIKKNMLGLNCAKLRSLYKDCLLHSIVLI